MNVREKALALGFDRVGIAPVEPLERAAFYRDWLRLGYHGTMGYLERDPDPQKLLPGARSVVCVLKNYYTDVPAPEDPKIGRISRYAWGDDYHDVLFEKLKELKSFLESGGARAKVCVDTSAVLEKLWARRSGLGWQGKHTNLISRDLSSWFFLGEVITDAAFEYDAPHLDDHCGTCTRCIEICPTRAIVAPYVLDSRKCISYLTIENRGPIPRDLRPLMGNLIFGCDLCQDVCPWNKFAKVTPEASFLPREPAAKLVDFLAMTRDEFRVRFKGSPVKRAKHAGFLRNVCVALGNSGDASAIPALEKALAHEEPLVRGHAAWALGRLGARASLESRLGSETDESVREEIFLQLRA